MRAIPAQVVATPATALRHLQRSLPPEVAAVLRRLAACGGRPVVVGGAVRDAFLGRQPADWDIAVDLPVAIVAGAFSRVAAVGTGRRHGTVMVLHGGHPVEVSSTATGGLLADLQCRDFTFNAIAADLRQRCLIDPCGGIADLQGGCIRSGLDPQARLQADPLRALRAARFVAQLGFRVDRATQAAMAAVAPRLAAVAAQRQGSEMQRLVAARHLGRALALLQRTDLLRWVVPAGVPALPWKPTMGSRLERLPPHAWLRLAAWVWLAGGSAAACEDLLQHWHLGSALCRRARQCCVGATLLGPRPPRGAALRRWTAMVGVQAAPGAWALATLRWPRAYQQARPRLHWALRHSCLEVGQLAIDGHALRAAGLPPRDIGATLQMLLAAVLAVPQRNQNATLLRLTHTLSTGFPGASHKP